MCREAYGDPNYYVLDRNAGRFNLPSKIYCGRNIHHILPVAQGGTNARENLLCTNIAAKTLFLFSIPVNPAMIELSD